MCLIPKDFILGHSLHLSAFGGDFSAKKCEQLACTHTTSRTPFLFECFKKKVQFCERMFGINRQILCRIYMANKITLYCAQYFTSCFYCWWDNIDRVKYISKLFLTLFREAVKNGHFKVRLVTAGAPSLTVSKCENLTFFPWNMILWCTKHISFHALFMISNWNYVLYRLLNIVH